MAKDWQSINDRTVDGLLKKIAEIKTPIAVKYIFPYGNRVYAIIGGDVRIIKKGKNDGRSNS